VGFKTEEDVRAFTEWAQSEIIEMGRYAQMNGLVTGQPMGKCVWALPEMLFIGKVWPKDDRAQVFWIISGPGLPTDHIEGSLAETAREVAKHFSLKWQLQSSSMENLDPQSASAEEPVSKSIDMADVAKKLQEHAEALYSLVARDEMWDTEANAIDKQLPEEILGKDDA
jgi:hypothetical protein